MSSPAGEGQEEGTAFPPLERVSSSSEAVEVILWRGTGAKTRGSDRWQFPFSSRVDLDMHGFSPERSICHCFCRPLLTITIAFMGQQSSPHGSTGLPAFLHPRLPPMHQLEFGYFVRYHSRLCLEMCVLIGLPAVL